MFARDFWKKKSCWRCSVKKVFLKILQNPQQNTCVRGSIFLKRCEPTTYYFVGKETLVQVVSYEFCKFCNNTYFVEHMRTVVARQICLCETNLFLFSWLNLKANFNTNQKQPPEVFYKSRCSLKFVNIYRKTPVLESLFNNFAGLNTGVFLWILPNF